MAVTIAPFLKSLNPGIELDLMPVCYKLSGELFKADISAVEAAYHLADLIQQRRDGTITVPEKLSRDQTEDWIVGQAVTRTMVVLREWGIDSGENIK